MKTFKFKSTVSGPDAADGTVKAESSGLAIKSIQEGAGLDPGTYILTSGDEHITFSIPDRPQPPAKTGKRITETRECRSFGRKVRWIANGIFPGCFLFLMGLAFYVSSLESLERYSKWLFGLIFVVGFFSCAFTRLAVEFKLLESFVCPVCHTPNDDWQKDSKYQIYYKCGECGIKWDIGYKQTPGGR
jgi:hypothetical protein